MNELSKRSRPLKSVTNALREGCSNTDSTGALVVPSGMKERQWDVDRHGHAPEASANTGTVC